MKNLLLFLLLVFSGTITARAQDAPTFSVDEKGQSQLVFVIPTTGTQDELFLRGKDWVYKSYASGKTVEQYEDKPAGRLSVKARAVELGWKVGMGITNDAGAFAYALTLDFKDGKARMLVDNIIYQEGTLKNAMNLKSGANLADAYPANWPRLGLKSMTAHWNGMQETTKADLIALAKSFQAAIASAPKKADW